MLDKLHNRLIKIIVGNKCVIINAKINKGSININSTKQKAFIYNTVVIGCN